MHCDSKVRFKVFSEGLERKGRETGVRHPSLSLVAVSEMVRDCPMVRIIEAVSVLRPATQSD